MKNDDENQPPLNTDFLRVYGHPLDSKVEKVYLTLGAKEIPFQKCILDDDYKPQWLLDIYN